MQDFDQPVYAGFLFPKTTHVEVKSESASKQGLISNRYYSAMQLGPGLQFYCVIAYPKVVEQHISTKYCKYNTFQVISDFPHELM